MNRRLLFLDIQPPEPDRNASSVRSVQLLELLVEQGYAVDFAPWRPAERPAQAGLMRRLGVRALPWLDDAARCAFLAAEAAHYGTVYCAWSNVARRFLAPARRAAPGAMLVYDTHDVNHVRAYREARVNGNQRTLLRALEIKGHEAGAMREADVTIAITEADAAQFRALAPTAAVAVVTIWSEPAAVARRPDPATVLFVGNFGTPHNHDAGLVLANQILPALRVARPDARLILAGNEPRAEIQALASERVTVTGWVPDLAPLLASATVFAAPLRFGSGIKGKILQAMAHGVPIVASAIAAEGIGLSDGVDFLRADTPAATAAAAAALIADPARGMALAARARELLAGGYSRAAVARQLAAALAAGRAYRARNNAAACHAGAAAPPH